MAVQACNMFFLGEWGGVHTTKKKSLLLLDQKSIQTYITRKEKSQTAEKDIS